MMSSAKLSTQPINTLQNNNQQIITQWLIKLFFMVSAIGLPIIFFDMSD
jgi:hypothetical protein